MAKLISPTPRLAFLDSDGKPLIGGKLYTYAAGSTTPLATYTDSTGNTPNANPVILDARGEADIWLSAVYYKFVLKDSLGSTIWTVDNIIGLGSTAAATQYESWVIVCSDETTAITDGAAKVTIPYWPFSMAVTEVVVGLTTAQATGDIFTLDINDDGTSILSTKATIDNTELTTETATTPLVIVEDTVIPKGSKVTIDFDQVGAESVATGVKVIINGYRT